MKNNLKLKFLFILTLSIYSYACMALPEDRQKVIHIYADKMLWQQKQQQIKYSGNVEIKQGQLLLRAESVYASKKNRKSAKDKISIFIAKGDKRQAIFKDKPRRDEGEILAWANEIIYDARQRKITLTGKARILRERDELQAPILYYYLDSRDIEAKKDISSQIEDAGQDLGINNNGRINITISPETLKSENKNKAQNE